MISFSSIKFFVGDQEKLNHLNAEWKSCAQEKKMQLAAANRKKVKYVAASKSHKSCRAAEAALYTENVECHEEWLSRKKEKELKCKAYAEVTKKYGDSNANKQIVTKGGLGGPLWKVSSKRILFYNFATPCNPEVALIATSC